MQALPFIKRRKLPRHQEPTPDKMVGLSSDEQLEDHCVEELMQACTDKDPKKFRQAVEALVMHGFDYGDDDE